MHFKFLSTLTLVTVIAAVWSGCATTQKADAAADARVTKAVCVLQPTAGNKASGTVTFTQSGGKVKVVADIAGLEPDSKHGFHIHEFGDISKPDGTGTGGHYNPEGHPHGLPPASNRHAGDLGNVTADAQGNAHYEITVGNITIDGHEHAVLGRAIILHAKPDDGGQPTGNAGARIAQGVIGVAK
jgi:superoxide dismutase, Cu-Zn family